MIRVAICDDERESRENVASLVGEYAESREDKNIVVSSFFSAQQLIGAVEECGGFDIYLLDVVMPEMTGIDLGLEIRKCDTDGKIIYITTTPEYGVNSYLAGAFFYLLKPIDKEQLFGVLDSAVEQVRNRKEKSLMIKTRDETMKVSFDSILYVELVRRSLVWNLTDGTCIKGMSLRVPFSEAVELLTDDDRFFLCGASCVINLYHVTSVSRDAVVFKKTKKIFMPKSACTSLRSAWLDFWLKRGGN